MLLIAAGIPVLCLELLRNNDFSPQMVDSRHDSAKLFSCTVPFGKVKLMLWNYLFVDREKLTFLLFFFTAETKAYGFGAV